MRRKFHHPVATCLICSNVHAISEVLAQLNQEGAERDEQAGGALPPYVRQHITRFGEYQLAPSAATTCSQVGHAGADHSREQGTRDQDGFHRAPKTSKAEAEKAKNGAPDEAFLVCMIVSYDFLQAFMA